MANKSDKLSDAKTIRDFLSSKLGDNSSLKIIIEEKLTPVYNVDVIWDGGNYYLAYTTSTDSTTIVIRSLDSVLPIQIETTTSST